MKDLGIISCDNSYDSAHNSKDVLESVVNDISAARREICALRLTDYHVKKFFQSSGRLQLDNSKN